MKTNVWNGTLWSPLTDWIYPALCEPHGGSAGFLSLCWSSGPSFRSLKRSLVWILAPLFRWVMLDSLCRPLASQFFRLRGGAQEHLTCQAVCREVTETLCLTLPTGCLARSRCWAKNGCLYVGVICSRECALCAGHFFFFQQPEFTCMPTYT